MNPTSDRFVLDSIEDPVLGRVVDELAARIQAGETVDIEAAAGEHPAYADQLRRLMPVIQALAGLSSGAARDGDSRESARSLPTEAVTGTLGDFRILREVGRGGMGVVYEAEQISLRRRVALKVLPFAATMDPRHLQRFHNEAQAAACLHHTNIVPVFYVGCERGVHFYAMQFIDGQPLSEIIRQLRGGEKKGSQATIQQPTAAYQVPPEGDVVAGPTVGLGNDSTPLSGEGGRGRDYFRRVAELGVQAAAALDHAHQLGIVHRDIKPANLLLDARGNVWVTDFGLAHIQHSEASLTMTGDVVGTLRYMSPEQALAKRAVLDHRTDIYSLGVTLYELLTLQTAFRGKERPELLQQVAFEEPTALRRINKAIPAELEVIVLKAMDKRPQDRYATAQELADDLSRWLNDMPIRARRPTLLQRAAKWMHRHRAIARSAVGFLVLAVFLLATSTVLIWRANQETKAALGRADAKSRWARRAVNDMYTDVAEKWLTDEPGMSEVQQQFLWRAIQFYEELTREKCLEPDERLERGLAYRRMGNIQKHFPKQQRQAIAAYEQSVAVLEDLDRECPGCAAYREELIRSYRCLGDLLRNEHRYPESESHLRQSVGVSSKLAEDFPDVPGYKREQAACLSSLGEWCRRTDRCCEAERLLQKALNLLQNLIVRFPSTISYQEDLGHTYIIRSELMVQLGDLVAAESDLRNGVDVFAKLLARSPRSPSLRSTGVGGCCNALGYVLLELGKYNEAEQVLQRSLQAREKVHAEFPRLRYALHGLALTSWNYGRLLVRTGRKREAIEAFKRALRYQQEMVDQAPDHPSRRQELAAMSGNLAWLYLIGPAPLRDVQKAFPLVRRALELEPDNPTHLTALGAAYYRDHDWNRAVDTLASTARRFDQPGRQQTRWISDASIMRRQAEGDESRAAALRPLFLAMSYWRQGEFQAAMDCYQRALRSWQVVRSNNPPWAEEVMLIQTEASSVIASGDHPLPKHKEESPLQR